MSLIETPLSEKTEETSIPKRKIIIVHRPNIKEWSYGDIITNYIPNTWEEVFAKTTNERKTIADVLTAKALPRYGELCPAKENIYRAFELTPLPKVRVVILGQDPYPQSGVAVGLSFSTSPNNLRIPGSLKNIFKEIKSEYPDFQIPKHGDLRDWARQGVLLLNMALTVPPGKPKEHTGVWKPFLIKTIRDLAEKKPDTIFVLWGNEAQKIIPFIGKAPVLVSGHPSPEAVNRGGDFLGNGCFKRVNDILKKCGEAEIDWQI